MSWVPRWRTRVISAETGEKKEARERHYARLNGENRKQLALVKKIDQHKAAYDKLVLEASLRRAPTQNGSARKAFLDMAKAEHDSQFALRPPDRQLFSRFYTTVDQSVWKMDEVRHWYNNKAKDDDEPDLELESYGYKAVGIPSEKRAATIRFHSTAHSRPFGSTKLLLPLHDGPRESVSAAQTRIFAKQPPPTPHHWLHFDLHLQHQKEKIKQNPMYGRLDVCAPPFRPFTAPAAPTAH